MSTPVSAASQSTKPTVWQIDPVHSAAHFSVRHLMISNVRGEFTKLTGSALIDPADLTKSKVEVTIETASINTREPQRDEHLRKAPTSSTPRTIPTITFRLEADRLRAPEHYIIVTGDLTIRGTTKRSLAGRRRPHTFRERSLGKYLAQAWSPPPPRSTAKDFGVAFNALTETGGVVVGDEVKSSIEAELIQQSPSRLKPVSKAFVARPPAVAWVLRFLCQFSRRGQPGNTETRQERPATSSHRWLDVASSSQMCGLLVDSEAGPLRAQ